MRQVVQKEGVGSLFRSYRTTIVMNIPYTAVHFSVYESAKKLQLEHWQHKAAAAAAQPAAVAAGAEEDDDEEGLAVQLVAGGLAGGSAAAVTTPLDVVKTRLQTEGVSSPMRYGTTRVVGFLGRRGSGF
jgi:solute carrier family 25 iron transporter 28/37